MPVLRFVQQMQDLVVRGLFKIRIPLPDAIERRRRMQARDFVRFALKRLPGFGCGNRHGGNNPCRIILAYGLKRHAHGRTRRKAVIHHDDDFSLQWKRWPPRAIDRFAALDFFPFT